MKVHCINDNWTLTGVGPKVGDVLEPVWVDFVDGKVYYAFEEYFNVPQPTKYKSTHFEPVQDVQQEEVFEEEGTILA